MKLINTISNSIGVIRDIHRNKYLSYKDIPKNWIKNGSDNYHFIDLFEIRNKYKRSDTIFILGNGPSLNLLNDSHWKHIGMHDSFGIGYSFLKDHIPTYHLIEYSYDKPFRDAIIRIFNSKEYRKHYTDVIFFIESKVYRRFGHPRLCPSFYPINCKCFKYNLAKPIDAQDENIHFNEEDFNRTVYYRGSMSHVLELCVNFFLYKRIVLLGVDLNTPHYFYRNFPEIEKIYQDLIMPDIKRNNRTQYINMVPKKGKQHTFEAYLYALCGYLKRVRGIDLYIWGKDNLLSPGLPSYFE